MYNDSFRLRYGNVPIAVSESRDFTDTLPHIHREVEIIYVKEGRSCIKIADETFEAKKGDLVFVSPMEIHSVKVNNDAPYYHRCICFDCCLMPGNAVSDTVKNGRIKLPAKLNSLSVAQCFEKLYEASESPGPAHFFETTGYISLIFAELVSAGLLNNDVQKSGYFSEKAMKYIEENFDEPVSSKTAAEYFHYTQSYFCRLFYENFGESFSNYLNIYRISKSKQMLEKHEKIADVAFSCGFTCPAYFSKCFKKYTGMLPSDYRKCQYSS